MQTKKFLDIENTTILKGLAILMIVMHELTVKLTAAKPVGSL